MIIVNLAGHRVAPLHPEMVAFDIITMGIIFGCGCHDVRYIPTGAVWGVICEIGTTSAAVFVPLPPGTTTSAGLVAGRTMDTAAW